MINQTFIEIVDQCF